jgi:hypothetical protein
VLLRTFAWSIVFTAIGLALALWYDGATGISVTAILIVLEVSLSFDNAVVNAKILERMSAFWQRMFLTIGMVIAVFGMRLLFPLLVVGISAQLSPWRAWQLALEKGDPHEAGTYGFILNQAHPAIAAFGGIFLLMIFLDFLLDPDKDVHWIGWLERRLQRIGLMPQSSVILGLVVLFVASRCYTDHATQVLTAGVLGLVAYLLVNSAAQGFAGEHGGGIVAGKAAFSLFLYLQVLDASFSFDGVIGAFAITADPIVIALGLGIGALYVRSLTIYMVHRGTLSQLIYLESGAHWAIGALAVLLLVSIGTHVPEAITGLIGVAFIGAAFLASLRFNHVNGAEATPVE